jgi:hypothetical protein
MRGTVLEIDPHGGSNVRELARYGGGCDIRWALRLHGGRNQQHWERKPLHIMHLNSKSRWIPGISIAT